MDEILYTLLEILSDPNVYAVIIGVIASIFGFYFAAKSHAVAEIVLTDREVSDEIKERPEFFSRLKDIGDELDRQQSIFWWSSRSATVLTFSQYIIGGILASSFIQQNISPNVVGILGVLVLISSLIHQRYRPDLHAVEARQRMYRVRKLIRAIEDDMFAIKNNAENAPSIFDVRRKASAGLSEIEDSEIEGAALVSAGVDPD